MKVSATHLTARLFGKSHVISDFTGVSVVHFQTTSNQECKQISPFLDTLCARYPSINFLKVASSLHTFGSRLVSAILNFEIKQSIMVEFLCMQFCV